MNAQSNLTSVAVALTVAFAVSLSVGVATAIDHPVVQFPGGGAEGIIDLDQGRSCGIPEDKHFSKLLLSLSRRVVSFNESPAPPDTTEIIGNRLSIALQIILFLIYGELLRVISLVVLYFEHLFFGEDVRN